MLKIWLNALRIQTLPLLTIVLLLSWFILAVSAQIQSQKIFNSPSNLHPSDAGRRYLPQPSASTSKYTRKSSWQPAESSIVASIHHKADDSLAEYRSINDWAIADMILVSSIDGSLHALDRKTGLKLWEIPGDKPLVQVATSESLKLRSQQYFSSPDTKCDDCEIIWIVEPQGEGLLYYFTPETGLQQLPITIKELVMQSPFSLRGDDKIYIGSHSTTLYSIESGTGKILKAYGSGKSSFSQANHKTKPALFYSGDDDDEEDEDDDLLDNDDEDDEFGFGMSGESSFLIGRTGM